MKRTNNILSYLLLQLLLMVTACTDEGREVASINQQMQESDLVELSIRTQVPEMEVGSRAATENISAITAFAFSDESILIKKVDALLSNPTDTTGTLKIKVPKLTRSIHFVAKNGDSYDAGNYTLGTTTLQDLLVDKTTTDLHYWGMLTFADAEALNSNNLSLTLYRNMAKVVLELGEGLTGTIAGFLNYNGNGTLIPHDANGTLGYQANAVTLPEDKGVASHDSPQGLGTECFLSEHANDESNRLYAICYIGGKYYKIAFSNSSGVFFPLVRNHLYRIVINQISGGSDSYGEAKDADPINGNVREETLNVTSVPLTSYKGKTTQVTVTIPDGVTSLRVTSLPEQFDISSTEVTLTDNVCDVTDRQSVNFILTLKDAYIGTTGTPNISFSGSGPSVSATGTGTVTLNGFKDMYEMYVDNSNLNGSLEYTDFFHTRNNTNVNNQSLTTEYVDAGANNSTLAHNHNTAAINMQNESSITFTIADTRYLTLLVARSSNAPSINITGTLKDDGSWSTENTAESLTTGKYNFGTDGDITTSGRLIRYTLEPGTYTLQRGNNDYDYLLYYMRVTTDKPIMTDIAQPLVTDYELAWSGGEFQDDKAKGYLKIDETNSKHIVNEDKLTHTVTLKSDGNSLNTSLNLNLTTFTLNKIDLNVATTRITFQSTNENNINKKDTTQYIPAQTNSCNIPKYNAGTYTLTATIGNPKYKYEIFYDSLKLKSVEYEVKSPVMPALYNSMDGSKLTPVKEFTSQDEAWAIGFKMPMVVPADPSSLMAKYKDYTIDINIPDWRMSDDISSGLGVIEVNDGNYKLGTQNDSNGKEMIHPREGWTYKIALASIAGNSIVPSLEDGNKDSDTDHYFTYGGTIAKAVTIPVTYTEKPLDISLDFYTENNVAFNNLVFGETKFYLKATIPSGVTPGSRIELDMDLSDGRTGIHETDSRDAEYSNGISYRYDNGTVNGLVINTVKDQTEYWICWKYVRSDGGATNDVSLNYTISSDTHTLSGETSANITIKGNGQASGNVNELNLPLNINLDFYREYSNGNQVDTDWNNLIYGVSRFGLKATITIPDDQNAADYYGKLVYLQGAFSNISGTGNAGIHWDNSRDSGNEFEIAYKSEVNHDGTQLQFAIEEGKTEYDIEWVFEGGSRYDSNNNNGDIGFTYTISATNNNHSISGSSQNSATLGIKRVVDIHSGVFNFSTGNKWDTNLTFYEIFPIGTQITIDYLAGQNNGGCTIKLCESNGVNQLYIPDFVDDAEYGPKQNLYMNFNGAKTFVIDVDTDIEIYQYVANNNDPVIKIRNLSSENPLNGLQLQGTDAVLQKVKVTAPPSAFPQ